MCRGRRRGGDCVGMHTAGEGSTVLPDHVTIGSICSSCSPKQLTVRCKSQPFARGYHTTRAYSHLLSSIMEAPGAAADTTRRWCCQPNQCQPPKRLIAAVVAAAAAASSAGNSGLHLLDTAAAY